MLKVSFCLLSLKGKHPGGPPAAKAELFIWDMKTHSNKMEKLIADEAWK